MLLCSAGAHARHVRRPAVPQRPLAPAAERIPWRLLCRLIPSAAAPPLARAAERQVRPALVLLQPLALRFPAHPEPQVLLLLAHGAPELSGQSGPHHQARRRQVLLLPRVSPPGEQRPLRLCPHADQSGVAPTAAGRHAVRPCEADGFAVGQTGVAGEQDAVELRAGSAGARL